MLLWTSRSVWGTKENCYFGLQVSVPNRNSPCAPLLLLVHRNVVLRFFIFFYLYIFTDKKSLDVTILPTIWFLKFFLLSWFHLVFLPPTFASLPLGVMLLNRSITPRDSATDIEKTSQKGASARERTNRSVVKTKSIIEHFVNKI